MATRQKKNNKLSGLTIPLVCIALIAYFGYHGFQGKLGIYASAMMDRETLQLEYELTRLKLERQKLAHRVELLRNGKIEKDMLDQQARSTLSVAQTDERIILMDESSN